MPTLSGPFDMILADLPYGTTACKWDTVIPFKPLWEQYKRLIKPKGAIVLFGSQPFTSALVMSNPKWFKYCWVWDKVKPSGFQVAKYRPMMRQEDIAVFAAGACQYYPQMTNRERTKTSRAYSKSLSNPVVQLDCSMRTYTERYPQSILRFSTANQSRKLHPTQKPVALLEYLIRTYTNEGETVLDNTMGSGSTGVACVNTGRSFVGIELLPEYYEIAETRIEQAQAEMVQERMPI
jgi:site-specific DNA-methyltransferase (adenine-specific)